MGRIFIVFLILLSFPSQAQFDPSTMYVGGFASYSFAKNTELSGNAGNSTQSSLANISVGIFPVKKLLIGINFGLLSSKERAEDIMDPSGFYYYEEIEEKTLSYTAGPFARYYIVKGLYGEVNFLLGKSKTRSESTTVDLQNQITYSGWEETSQGLRGFAIGAGYSIFLDKTKTVALDVSVGYQRYEAASKFSGIAAGLGISGFLFKSM
jgi:hypothetical protein